MKSPDNVLVHVIVGDFFDATCFMEGRKFVWSTNGASGGRLGPGLYPYREDSNDERGRTCGGKKRMGCLDHVDSPWEAGLISTRNSSGPVLLCRPRIIARFGFSAVAFAGTQLQYVSNPHQTLGSRQSGENSAQAQKTVS